MRNFIAKRIISCALAVILIVSLSAGIMAQASSPIANEGKLLEAANPILTAYKEHYVLNNVRVTNLSESSKGNGEQYIEFFLTFDATLKYDSIRARLDTSLGTNNRNPARRRDRTGNQGTDFDRSVFHAQL